MLMVRSAGLAALVACASAFAPAPGVLPGSLSASHSQRLSAGSLSLCSPKQQLPTAALRVSPGGMRKQPQQLAMNFVTHYGKSLHIRAAYIFFFEPAALPRALFIRDGRVFFSWHCSRGYTSYWGISKNSIHCGGVFLFCRVCDSRIP